LPLYESISILKPSLGDEDVQKIVSKLEGIARKNSEWVATENWGKKKLAYDIQKEKRGIYILFRFRGDGKNIPELERACGFDDNILKFMTVKLGKAAAAHAERPAQAAPAAPQNTSGAPAAGEGQ
jgi:small subunit ribosomal protein S6